MKFFSVIVLMLCSLGTIAQYDPSKISKKAMDLYEKGLEKARDGDFDEGIKTLQQAVKISPKFLDAYL